MRNYSNRGNNWQAFRANKSQKLADQVRVQSRRLKALEDAFNAKYETVRLDRGVVATVTRLKGMGRTMSNAETEQRIVEIKAMARVRAQITSLKAQANDIRRGVGPVRQQKRTLTPAEKDAKARARRERQLATSQAGPGKGGAPRK